LDIKDDHIPDEGIGVFLTNLNEVKQYIQRDWREYNACTKHYKRFYQIVEVLAVLPDDHIVEYKKLDEVEEQQRKKQDKVEQQQEVESAPCDTERMKGRGRQCEFV
jgi:hypothetical protein